jgi:hypothetical protein
VNERRPHDELRAALVVPARPGPLVRLRDLERGRDELDELIDDVFGEADDRGPGPVDAVLVVGGLGAIIGGQAASLPTAVTVCGAAALGLGAVLPLRSLWRRAGSARRSSRLRSLLGEGLLLRTDHPAIEQLLAVHERLLSVAAPLATAPQARVHDVAHAALLEVVSLLGGRTPGAHVEIDYVDARTQALKTLATTVADPRVGDGDSDRRRSLVEQLSGSSSLTEAADLACELLGTDDP